MQRQRIFHGITLAILVGVPLVFAACEREVNVESTAKTPAATTESTASSESVTAASFQYKGYNQAKVSGTAGSGNTVTFQGKLHALEGTGITVGEAVRSVRLTSTGLELIDLAATAEGKVRIISTVPSLDTPVCEEQTHYLSEKNGGLDNDVELITISVDTPFAQQRFAKEAQINNVTFFSDYRGGEFGRANGLLIPDLHILARTIWVVDKDNTIKYMQVVPEIGELPDMEAAFEAARALL